MKLTEQILQRMMQWEGCRLVAYRCPAGVLTIGFGHTGPDVMDGLVISRRKAEDLFREDTEKFAGIVGNIFARVPLTDNQFSALVSLAYNIGPGNLRKSALCRMVLANPADPAIRNEFMKHTKARINGILKELPGLVARRRAEADIYFSL